MLCGASVGLVYGAYRFFGDSLGVLWFVGLVDAVYRVNKLRWRLRCFGGGCYIGKRSEKRSFFEKRICFVS
jgi:hypothetical protein